MLVKELIEELKKYPEDTNVYVEYPDDDMGLIRLNDEFDIDYHDNIHGHVDGHGFYYSYFGRQELNNVLVIK